MPLRSEATRRDRKGRRGSKNLDVQAFRANRLSLSKAQYLAKLASGRPKKLTVAGGLRYASVLLSERAVRRIASLRATSHVPKTVAPQVEQGIVARSSQSTVPWRRYGLLRLCFPKDRQRGLEFFQLVGKQDDRVSISFWALSF